MALYPLKRLKHAGRVVVAGAEDPGVVRHVGFETVGVDRGRAGGARSSSHGPYASIAFVPYPPAVSRS